MNIIIYITCNNAVIVVTLKVYWLLAHHKCDVWMLIFNVLSSTHIFLRNWRLILFSTTSYSILNLSISLICFCTQIYYCTTDEFCQTLLATSSMSVEWRWFWIHFYTVINLEWQVSYIVYKFVGINWYRYIRQKTICLILLLFKFVKKFF